MVQSFHELHPHKAFQTFEKQQLNDKRDYIKDEMINNYRELFYNFNTNGNYCNICQKHIFKPLGFHLIIECEINII